jgi:quercetin dioxygenase-like cupin family protein
MSRRPSPRPSFTTPTVIPYRGASMHLWGDPESGWVSDRIYVSSEKMHQLELTIPSGGRFQHSDSNRTFFAADEVFVVLAGVLAMANPQTGEVHRAEAGEAVFFRRDTWHHGFSVGDGPVRVLEYFCPPPAQGTSSQYALAKDNLREWHYTDDSKLGRWPLAAAELREKETMRVLGKGDLTWRLEGSDANLLVALYVSTEHLTVGRMTLLPGQQSGHRTHQGEAALYVERGVASVFTPNDGPPSWFELEPGDGFFVPEGSSYELFNFSGDTVEAVFGVAPEYRSPASSR